MINQRVQLMNCFVSKGIEKYDIPLSNNNELTFIRPKMIAIFSIYLLLTIAEILFFRGQG